MNIDKEILQSLVKDLKRITGKTQGELSKGMGYNEKYISTAMSGGDNLQPIIDQLQLFFKKELLQDAPIALSEAMIIAIIKEISEIRAMVTDEKKEDVMKRLLDATGLILKAGG